MTLREDFYIRSTPGEAWELVSDNTPSDQPVAHLATLPDKDAAITALKMCVSAHP